MSQLYVPGPASIWIARAAADEVASPTYEYLGQTLGDMGLALQAEFEDVHVDFSGPRVPYDVQFMGIEAFLAGTLIKYNFAVFQKLAARIAFATFGETQDGDIGTLIRTERKFFLVAVSCPYFSKAAFGPTSVSPMIPGYTFHCCYLHGGADSNLSVQAKRQRFQIRCIPYYPASGVSAAGKVCSPVLPVGLPLID